MEGDDLWSTALTGEQAGQASVIPRRRPLPAPLNTNNNNYDSNVSKDYYVADRPRMFTEKKSYEDGQYKYGAAPPPGEEEYYRSSPSPDRRPAVAHPPPVFPQPETQRKPPIVQSTQELASRKYFSQKRNILNMKKIMKPEALTPTDEAAKKAKMLHFNGKPADADEWDEEPPDLRDPKDTCGTSVYHKTQADGIFYGGGHEDRLLFYNTRPNSSSDQNITIPVSEAVEVDPRKKALEDYHKYHFVAKKSKPPGTYAKNFQGILRDDSSRRQGDGPDDEVRYGNTRFRESASNDGTPIWHNRREKGWRSLPTNNASDQQVPLGERVDPDGGHRRSDDDHYSYRDGSSKDDRRGNSYEDDTRFDHHPPSYNLNESPRRYAGSNEREPRDDKRQYPVKRLYPVKGNRVPSSHQQSLSKMQYDHSDKGDLRVSTADHDLEIPLANEAIKSKGTNKEDIMKMLIDAGNKSVADYRKIKEEGKSTTKTTGPPATATTTMKFIVNYPGGIFSQAANGPTPVPNSTVTTVAPPPVPPTVVPHSHSVPQPQPGNCLIPVARPPPNAVIRQLDPSLAPHFAQRFGPPRIVAPGPAPMVGSVPSVQILPAGAAVPAGAVPVQGPHFPMLRGGVIPSVAPPRVAPPGVAPPGVIPPGVAPPGVVPPGVAPPGVVPPGVAPPGVVPPGVAAPGIIPARIAPPGVAPPVLPIANQLPMCIPGPPQNQVPQFVHHSHPLTPRFVTSPIMEYPPGPTQLQPQLQTVGVKEEKSPSRKKERSEREPKLFCDLELDGR